VRRSVLAAAVEVVDSMEAAPILAPMSEPIGSVAQ
jgi:alanine dehydrogenase